MGIRVQPLFGLLAFWVLLIALRQGRFPGVLLLALVLIAAFLSALWRKSTVRERALALMAEVLGIFYFVLFLYPAIPVRYDFGPRIGMQWILLLLVVIWAGDTFALLAGKSFGKHLLAPVLSPKKTYEGAVAGLLGGIGIAVAVQHPFLPELPMVHVIIVSLLLGVFGQIGDLAESLLKRAAKWTAPILFRDMVERSTAWIACCLPSLCSISTCSSFISCPANISVTMIAL